MRLLDPPGLTDFEKLKRRSGSLSPLERAELERLKALAAWEDRINAPVPKYLARTSWPGVAGEREALKAAYRYLSWNRGQAFGAERARPAGSRLWEVDVYYSPPARLRPEDAARIPLEWAAPGRHPAGKLWIDAVTGEVRESLEEAQGAAAS